MKKYNLNPDVQSKTDILLMAAMSADYDWDEAKRQIAQAPDRSPILDLKINPPRP